MTWRNWQAALTGRLDSLDRWLIAAAALAVVLALLLPIWRVHLWAPQYPEGLNLYISARDLSGNLQQVNIMNHYIGMKPLTAEAFPEFKWLTPILLSLGGLLGLAAVVGRRWLMLAAWSLLVAFDFYMLWDLYAWMHEWGFHLDPRAPIRVAPFMPPVVGFKHIANFYVWSLPTTGGILIILASLIGPVLTWRALKRAS